MRARLVRAHALSEDDPLRANVLDDLGQHALHEGRPEEALELHREAAQVRVQSRGPEDPGLADALTDQGQALVSLGRPAEAVAVLPQSLSPSAPWRRGRSASLARPPSAAQAAGMHRFHPVRWLVCAALACAACSNGDRLVPLVREPSDVPAGASVTRSAGVRMVAAPNAWDGPESILDDVMPVWIQVTNETGRTLAVSHHDFRLVAPDGSVYAAMHPGAFEGRTEVPLATLARGPDGTLELPGVQYAWGYYPGPRVAYEYAYVYDETVEVSLPTPGMLERALRPGPLPDGRVKAGFVYFDRIDFDGEPVHLTYTLTDPATGLAFDTVEIPFDTDD